MFQHPTCFVIGAGCSSEFNLPMGAGLVDRINQLITMPIEDTNPLFATLRQSEFAGHRDQFMNLMMEFRAGLYLKPSIDQFLQWHKDNEPLVALGKMAIALVILEAEVTSLISPAQMGGSFKQISKTWLGILFNLMNDSVSMANVDIIFRNVTFICFNYDRCLEVFFIMAVQALLSCPFNEAAAITSANLRIVHPYGTVGPTWTKEFKPDMAFLRDFHQTIIIAKDAPKNLRTFTEGCEDKDFMFAMHQAIESAQHVIFLGFSYLDQNMNLLKGAARFTPIALR